MLKDQLPLRGSDKEKEKEDSVILPEQDPLLEEVTKDVDQDVSRRKGGSGKK